MTFFRVHLNVFYYILLSFKPFFVGNWFSKAAFLKNLHVTRSYTVTVIHSNGIFCILKSTVCAGLRSIARPKSEIKIYRTRIDMVHNAQFVFGFSTYW